MLEHPFAAYANVLFVIDRGEPDRLNSGLARGRLQQIPLPGRAVAVHLDSRIHQVVDREGKHVRRAAEKTADILASLSLAKLAAIPDRVFGKEFCDRVSIVIIIASGGVARLEELDFLDVRKLADPRLERFHSCTHVADSFYYACLADSFARLHFVPSSELGSLRSADGATSTELLA